MPTASADGRRRSDGDLTTRLVDNAPMLRSVNLAKPTSPAFTLMSFTYGLWPVIIAPQRAAVGML